MAPPAPAGVEYTCPMHPEVRKIGPGTCPKCGMALEPRLASAEAESPELAEMTRRFWISAALTTPLLVLMVADMIPGRAPHGFPGGPAGAWLQLALATPVVLWGGWPFFVRGWQSILSRHLNMFTLIALGTGTAYLYSVVATLAPGRVPGVLPRPRRRPRPLLRAGSGHRHPRPARAGARAARTRADEQRDSRAAGPGSPDGAPPARGRLGGGDPAGRGPGRRSPSGPSGREDPRRRHRGGGHQRRGRIHGHGRVDARRQGAGRPRHRRHRQHHGQLRDGGPARGRGHASRADRARRRRSAALAGTGPAPGRHRGRLVRPRGAGRGRGHVRGLGAAGARAAAGPRPRQRGSRAHHRLPLCPGPGHAHGGDGGHRPRSPGGRARARRGSAGTIGEGLRPPRRQDGHPHRGATVAGDGRGAGGIRREARSCGWPPASSAAASTRWPPPS